MLEGTLGNENKLRPTTSRLDLFDDGPGQGLCVVVHVERVVVVESGVQRNEKEGGSNHPEYGGSLKYVQER